MYPEVPANILPSFAAPMKQSTSWHNQSLMQPRHELHLQGAESAFSEALCVGIMFSRSPRAQREHGDECEGKAAVLAAELIKDRLGRNTPSPYAFP